jgi:hypothetical protein
MASAVHGFKVPSRTSRGAPVKTPIAVLVLLPLFALAVPVRASDDHEYREVEERFGSPQVRDTVDCIDQGRCIRWQYDSGTHHAVFYFDPRTQHLLDVYTWDDANHEATNTSEQVRSLLDSARNVSDP